MRFRAGIQGWGSLRASRSVACYAESAMPRPTGKARNPASPNRMNRSTKMPRIARIAERLGRMIPDEELRRIPKDLSSQVDHYVYGLPKR